MIYFAYVPFLIMNAQVQLRWQIIGAHCSGCTNSVIARSLGVSLTTVHRVVESCNRRTAVRNRKSGRLCKTPDIKLYDLRIMIFSALTGIKNNKEKCCSITE